MTKSECQRQLDAALHELQCVRQVLDAKGVPTEIAPGQPYSLHGRVAAGVEGYVPADDGGMEGGVPASPGRD